LLDSLLQERIKMNRQETTLKSNMKKQSTGSLPRTPMQLDNTKMYRSMSTSSAYSSEFMSPTSPTLKDLEGMRSANLKELNGRLIAYVDKVRTLQQATDVLDSISKNSGGDNRMHEVKVEYEREIEDWRFKYEEILSLLNKANAEATGLKQENKQVNASLLEKLAMLKEKEGILVSMESEINELVYKLNSLQSEKGKAAEQERLLSKEVGKLKVDLSSSLKNLDKEKMRNAELEARMKRIEEEMRFNVQIVEKELVEERKKNNIDLSALDNKLKLEYESRFKAELKKLRKIYEDNTEKARAEYMTVHSRKLTELQEQLNMERSDNNSAGFQLQDVLARISGMKKRISELEQLKLELEQRVAEMDQNLNEQGASFRAQMTSKEKEIVSLQQTLSSERTAYEALMKLNNDLDLEIDVYRSIIDAELDRMQSAAGFSFEVKAKGSSDSSSDSDKEDKRVYRNMSKDSVDGRKISSRKITTTTRVSRSAKTGYPV